MNICIPFTPVAATQNPNIILQENAHSHDAYYQSIIVAFFSIRKFNEEANLILASEHAPPHKYMRQFEDLKVNISIVPFEHNPPKEYAKRFAASFYLFDAIMAQDNLDCLYLDPDVICMASLSQLFDNKEAISAYPLDYSLKHNINGLTLEDSIEITNAIYGGNLTKNENYKFFGGEFLFVPSTMLIELQRLIELFYVASIQRFAQGQSYYTTEEHILSAALSKIEIDANKQIIKRVWTASRYRNVTGNEQSFPLLHFPAEKEYGFMKAYKNLTFPRHRKNLTTDEHFREYVIKQFQLEKRSFARIATSIFLKIRRIFHIRNN